MAVHTHVIILQFLAELRDVIPILYVFATLFSKEY